MVARRTRVVGAGARHDVTGAAWRSQNHQRDSRRIARRPTRSDEHFELITKAVGMGARQFQSMRDAFWNVSLRLGEHAQDIFDASSTFS